MEYHLGSRRSHTIGIENESSFRPRHDRRRLNGILGASAVLHSVLCCWLASLALGGTGPDSLSATLHSDSRAFLYIQLVGQPKLSNVKAGSVLEGDLPRAVYSGYR